MAKRKGKRGVLTKYFRDVFDAHPEWLQGKSNDPILAQYRQDHGMAMGTSVDKKIKANLANLKSTLRKESRDVGKAARGGAAATPRGGSRLDSLEEAIDDCMTLAKNYDRVGLQQVIHLLRRARNLVVWKGGQ
jgi:hypothetical protein